MGINEELDETIECEVVELEFDDETTMLYAITGKFELDGNKYAILEPVDEENDCIADDGETSIYRYSEEADGEITFTEIEDEDEYDKVIAKYAELYDLEIVED